MQSDIQRMMRDYSKYFSNDKPSAYQWDVGPMSLRRIVAAECSGKVLEISPGLNRVFADSETMDVQGDPDYLRSLSDPCDDLAERFDTIVMVHVFEHIVQDEVAIENCYRMLRPGGALIVVSPGHESGICTIKETEENGHIRTMNLAYVRSMQRPTFRLRKYRSVHVAHNAVWNRLKYGLKAAYLPMKLIDRKEMYDRGSYRWLAPRIASALDAIDRRITRAKNGNILFVLEKHEQRETMAGAAAGGANAAGAGAIPHGDSPTTRASARSWRALPLLPSLLLALLVIGYAGRDAGASFAPAPRSTTVADDSGGKKPDSGAVVDAEKRATVGAMPLQRADSTWKPVRIWVGHLDTSGVPPWIHIPWEAIDEMTLGGYWLARDSAYVFKDWGCLQWWGKLGVTPGVPDTVWLVDTCRNSCWGATTLPLGCYEWREEYIETPDSVRVCDTVCTARDTIRTYYRYWQIEQAQYHLLSGMYSCGAQTSSQQVKLVKKGNRWYGLTLPNVPFAYPVDDSCWIDQYAFGIYELTYGRYGAGLWYVDSSSSAYGTRVVDCSLYGLPGISRDTSNCEWIVRTNTSVRRWQEWVYSGRDTTIADDTCDCLEPYFICEGGALDSLRKVRYIYDFTTDPDTIKELCEKEYVIPIGAQTYYKGAENNPCTSDSTILAWVAANWFNKGFATWAPGRVPVTEYYNFGWVCRRCDDQEEPPFMLSTRYFAQAEISSVFPCESDTCVLEAIHYDVITGPCCEKDTSITFYCYDFPELVDSTIISYKTPNLDVLCSDSTIIGIVPGDTTIAIVDSVVTWEYFYSPISYTLAFRDTCICIPYLNGRLWCGPLWIVRDCDPPIYWGDDGRLHIPCNEVTQTDLTDLWDKVSSEAKRTQDSLAVLRAEIERLEAKIDSCCALSGGGEWAMSAETTDFEPAGSTLYFINATSGNVNVNLPDAAANSGARFTLKRVDSSENSVTIAGTVDGDTDPVIASLKSYTLGSNGTNWFFISTY